MTAAVVYILFVISSGNAPDLTALASYESRAACATAAEQVTAALAKGEDGKMLFCVASDSLTEMAQKNGVSGT